MKHLVELDYIAGPDDENFKISAEIEADIEKYKRPPCQECGAMTPEEAETRCNCGGDKDDCHGCHLWP